MSKTAAAGLDHQEARYKEQASQYLAEAQRILRDLAAECRRSSRRRPRHANLTQEVKAILQGV